MSSVGVELNVDTATDYDLPYRLRLGAATPVLGRTYFGKNNLSVYFAVGLSF